MNIQLRASKVTIEHEHTDNNLYLEGVDINNLVGEVSTKELLDAIVENNDLGVVVDYVTERMKEDE